MQVFAALWLLHYCFIVLLCFGCCEVVYVLAAANALLVTKYSMCDAGPRVSHPRIISLQIFCT